MIDIGTRVIIKYSAPKYGGLHGIIMDFDDYEVGVMLDNGRGAYFNWSDIELE